MYLKADTMAAFSDRDIYSYMIVTLTQVVELLKKHTQHQESFYYVDNMNANLMNQQTAQLPIASGTNNMIQAAKCENLKTSQQSRKQKIYPNSMPVL